MIATGTVIAYWVDFGLSYIDTSLSWRLPIGLQIIFAVILIFGTLYLPESPRYLLSTRQYVEGENVVAALSALPTDHEDTQLQKRVIVEALESIGQLEIKHVLTGGPSQHLRRTLVGASSQLFQQIGGCNAVIYFAYVYFRSVRPSSPNLSAAPSSSRTTSAWSVVLRSSSVVSTRRSTPCLLSSRTR